MIKEIRAFSKSTKADALDKARDLSIQVSRVTGRVFGIGTGLLLGAIVLGVVTVWLLPLAALGGLVTYAAHLTTGKYAAGQYDSDLQEIVDKHWP
jgi:hypothetical protein